MKRAFGVVSSGLVVIALGGCARREQEVDVSTRANGEVARAGVGTPTGRAAALKALGAGIREDGVLVEVAERALPSVVSVTSTRRARG